MKSNLPKFSGTYILLLYLKKGSRIKVGRLGEVAFKRGWYAYVGSAFGPGGLAARLKRHLRAEKKLRWHIDYLRTQAAVKKIYISHPDESLEHIWAAILLEKCARPILNFGCSDCRCPSHLFFFARRPDRDFTSLLQTSLDSKIFRISVNGDNRDG